MKEKKKERKNILPFGKIRSRETFRCTQGRYHKTTKAFSIVQSVKNFYLNKTDVIITVNTSHLKGLVHDNAHARRVSLHE